VLEVSKHLSKHLNKNKTRFSAGSGLMLEEFLFAAERWPVFEAFVVVSFPVGVIGRDAKERLHIEPEIGSVFEENPIAQSLSIVETSILSTTLPRTTANGSGLRLCAGTYASYAVARKKSLF